MTQKTRGIPVLVASLVLVIASGPQGDGNAFAFERQGTTQHAGKEFDTGRGLKACAALDLHHLTLIEDAGAAAGADHEEIAEVAQQIFAARRHCLSARFGEALEIYTQVATQELAVRWLR